MKYKCSPASADPQSLMAHGPGNTNGEMKRSTFRPGSGGKDTSPCGSNDARNESMAVHQTPRSENEEAGQLVSY